MVPAPLFAPQNVGILATTGAVLATTARWARWARCAACAALAAAVADFLAAALMAASWAGSDLFAKVLRIWVLPASLVPPSAMRPVAGGVGQAEGVVGGVAERGG